MDIDKKLDKYFSLTEKALKKVKIVAPKKTSLYDIAVDFLDMAKRYFDDAKHFNNKGDKLTALASVSYAHAWLDAGARIGLFDVDHDNILFVVD